MLPMVDAVPIVIQFPFDLLIEISASIKSSSVINPAFRSASNFQTPVPEPIVSPLCCPLSIGPPEIPMVGKSTLPAPINKDGVVLSQPINKTTPSIGLPRIASSTSMLAKFLNNIAVGLRFDSLAEKTGNSRGKPPAS